MRLLPLDTPAPRRSARRQTVLALAYLSYVTAFAAAVVAVASLVAPVATAALVLGVASAAMLAGALCLWRLDEQLQRRAPVAPVIALRRGIASH